MTWTAPVVTELAALDHINAQARAGYADEVIRTAAKPARKPSTRAKALCFEEFRDNEFHARPARYAKGMMAVTTVGRDGYKQRACRLASALANGRHSNRSRAYIMSASAAARFVKLYDAGWDATYNGELETPTAD